MIAYLNGQITFKSPSLLHMEVGGIGYEVQVSLHTYGQVQKMDRGKIFIYEHVKEDGQTLYGFHDPGEKHMFVQLIGINGVGATTARMMLSSLKPEEITQAVLRGDTRTLENVKGIGKKTAERIVLELRDKLGKGEGSGANSSSFIYNTLEQDALHALVALGIARPAAEQAVKKAFHSDPGQQNLETIIKKALQSI